MKSMLLLFSTFSFVVSFCTDRQFLSGQAVVLASATNDTTTSMPASSTTTTAVGGTTTESWAVNEACCAGAKKCHEECRKIGRYGICTNFGTCYYSCNCVYLD